MGSTIDDGSFGSDSKHLNVTQTKGVQRGLGHQEHRLEIPKRLPPDGAVRLQVGSGETLAEEGVEHDDDDDGDSSQSCGSPRVRIGRVRAKRLDFLLSRSVQKGFGRERPQSQEGLDDDRIAFAAQSRRRSQEAKRFPHGERRALLQARAKALDLVDGFRQRAAGNKLWHRNVNVDHDRRNKHTSLAAAYDHHI